MGKKYARFNVTRGELGGVGARSKRTVEFEFWDGEEKVGTLVVSTTKLFWRPAWKKRWHEVSVARLDDLFNALLGYR